MEQVVTLGPWSDFQKGMTAKEAIKESPYNYAYTQYREIVVYAIQMFGDEIALISVGFDNDGDIPDGITLQKKWFVGVKPMYT